MRAIITSLAKGVVNREALLGGQEFLLQQS